MKKFKSGLALILAAMLCAVGVSAETFVQDGVTYESAKVDDLRIVRYSPDKTETEFTISDASVNDYAFEGAKNLEKVTISDGVYYIGEYAFKDCTSLTEVVFEGACGVYCPENAFEGCTALDPVVIEELCWDKPFTDIFSQDPYYNAVKFVHKAGLMNGVSDSKFSPDTGMTRAMFVTVLGRLTGVDKLHRGVMTFSDVEEGQWYTDSVKWAAINGLVEGYGDGTFGINDPVTIEQAAVILARYARRSGGVSYDMESRYTDMDDISDWAMGPMSWVTYEGIYTGYDGGQLRPKQNAPRALVAQMLYNYVQMNDDAKESGRPTISMVYNPDWGLTLTASDVTNTGMTLTFTQAGGNPTGERLDSGWYYFLEVLKDGRWTKVSPIVDVNAWIEEGWTIPLGGEFVIDISWEPLYGELPAGQYRMGKRVLDFRSAGDYDYATFYAEFTIE